MTKIYEFSITTADPPVRQKRLYDTVNVTSTMPRNICTPNQEKNLEESREYRYYFPQSS